MRWVVIPVAAAMMLGISGFLDELEDTTRASVALAEAAGRAPVTTQEAAENVAGLPAIAELTSRQADAFETLADALQISAQRVFTLNETLDRQAGTIDDLAAGVEALSDPLECVERRLRRLGTIAALVPARLRNVPPMLARLIAAQEKSIRHLRSINRKLTALGVAAEASDVKAPPYPSDRGSAPEPGDPGTRPC